jgi:signal transduction histidine kinase
MRIPSTWCRVVCPRSDFTFCALSYEYSRRRTPTENDVFRDRHCQEALSNIIKHSDATGAQISFREQPGFYQLVISDNGSKKEIQTEKGIGLNNITSRVESLTETSISTTARDSGCLSQSRRR